MFAFGSRSGWWFISGSMRVPAACTRLGSAQLQVVTVRIPRARSCLFHLAMPIVPTLAFLHFVECVCVCVFAWGPELLQAAGFYPGLACLCFVLTVQDAASWGATVAPCPLCPTLPRADMRETLADQCLGFAGAVGRALRPPARLICGPTCGVLSPEAFGCPLPASCRVGRGMPEVPSDAMQKSPVEFVSDAEVGGRWALDIGQRRPRRRCSAARTTPWCRPRPAASSAAGRPELARARPARCAEVRRVMRRTLRGDVGGALGVDPRALPGAGAWAGADAGGLRRSSDLDYVMVSGMVSSHSSEQHLEPRQPYSRNKWPRRHRLEIPATSSIRPLPAHDPQSSACHQKRPVVGQ